MKILSRLTLSAYGLHLADQVALVSVPLIAALVFEAPVEIIGILVAAQSSAHLLGSLPCGLLVDRFQYRSLAIAATLISAIGFAIAALTIVFDNLIGFGIAVTFGGFGIVLFVLASLSILPKVAELERLAQANASIEIPRATASFLVPLIIGLMITRDTAEWLFLVAALGGVAAFSFARKLPGFRVNGENHESIIQRIVEGGKFVVNHELLLPISICSLFWNVAYSALLVLMVPLVVDEYLLAPGTFSIALSAFGLAAILGAWTAGRLSKWIAPNVILIFGPASSALAITTLIFIPEGGSVHAVYIAFFFLGFGPSMWLVTQNSIRQLVTPTQMLGRVNAVIQTAIYGVRPLGAVLSGAIVAATSIKFGLLLVVACFTASLAAALFSRLRSVQRYGASDRKLLRQV